MAAGVCVPVAGVVAVGGVAKPLKPASILTSDGRLYAWSLMAAPDFDRVLGDHQLVHVMLGDHDRGDKAANGPIGLEQRWDGKGAPSGAGWHCAHLLQSNLVIDGGDDGNLLARWRREVRRQTNQMAIPSIRSGVSFVLQDQDAVESVIRHGREKLLLVQAGEAEEAVGRGPAGDTRSLRRQRGIDVFVVDLDEALQPDGWV